MKEQLLKAWQINNNHNLLLIENITDKGLNAIMSTRGGRSVALQLAHVHNVRVKWLEICAKDIWKEVSVLDKESKITRKILTDAFTSSAKAIEKLMVRSWDDGGKVKGYKNGVIPMLGYFISHDSHHRGNILLTLKLSGEKIPDKVKWGLWEW